MPHPTRVASTLSIGSWLLAAGLVPVTGLAQPADSEQSPIPPPDASQFGDLVSQTFFLKLGFSFMVGLAVGYALKIAFKIALVVMGLILLAIFGLQYAGMVDVNWSGIEVHYNTWAEWASAHSSPFLDFIGQNLSSAASFLAGLAVGLKL
jgi:uncharacterized membrane protein (Fun14 family)